jgi:hydrogenase-4 component B
LPPLNGFVSEWLLLQAFLFAHEVPHPFVNMLLPLGASIVALAAALAAYVMVKFYGVVFLGQPREPSLADAHDAGPIEKAGLAWLAAGCVLLGVLPGQVVGALGYVTEQLTGHAVARAPGWSWLLAPLPDREVSYAPLVLLLVIAAVVATTFLAVRLAYRRVVRRAPPWDCGFVRVDARMQDTAEGFGQPIRHIFQAFFQMKRELPSPFDATPRYRVTIGDRIWLALYEPLGGIVQRLADSVAWLQQGRISTYLLYSFVTLVVLLAVVL